MIKNILNNKRKKFEITYGLNKTIIVNDQILYLNVSQIYIRPLSKTTEIN